MPPGSSKISRVSPDGSRRSASETVGGEHGPSISSNVGCGDQLASASWPQWRGVHRDGVGLGLPKKWSVPERLWRYELPNQGVGGIAASDELVVVSSRDRSDTKDVFCVLDAELGGLVNQLEYEAPGHLDYGNSPRATPVLTEDAVYLQGAMGHLHCIDSITGEIRWKKHLIEDLGGQLPIWGFTASPLLVDGKLIVQPGGPASSITALDASTGAVVWSTAGKKAAYASPVLLEIGITKQIVTFDEDTLGGWSLANGKRLWELRPKMKGDFNVPTPVVAGNQIVLVSENNAVRIHDFDPMGVIENAPSVESDALAGDSQTPILLGDWLVGVDGDLVVLDRKNKLAKRCTFSDRCLLKYSSLIGDEDRVLVACGDGTILLVRILKDSIEEIGRFSVLDDGGELLSHPALVNGVLYIRGTTCIEAYQWK